MAKGIKGDKIEKVKQVDDKTLHVILKTGRVLEFKAIMCDFDDCELVCKPKRVK